MDSSAIISIWVTWGMFWFLDAFALAYFSKLPRQLMISTRSDYMTTCLLFLLIYSFPLLIVTLLVANFFLTSDTTKRFNIVLGIIWTIGISFWLWISFMAAFSHQATNFVEYSLIFTVPALIALTMLLLLLKTIFKRLLR